MPDPVLARSRRVRTTPWTSRVEALGVRGYTVYNHMLLPTAFGTVEEDYHHLRSAVQLWDVGCERQVELRGPDALRLAQALTPRDLAGLELGRCMYAPVTDARGGMLNDPVILRVGADRVWLSVADSDIVLWAGGLALGRGLDVEVREPDVWPLAVQGPRAEDVVAAVLGEEARRIRFFRFGVLAFRGRPLVVARSGWSVQGGFEVYVDDPDVGRALWDALWEAGQPAGIRPGCPNLIERIEGGLLSYGNDMTRADTPLECGLERYCDLDAELDFIGRDALRAQRERGITRRLRGVALDGPATSACVEPWPLAAGDAAAGEVRSAAWSPRLGCTVAIAMVERDAWAAGTAVVAETPDGPRAGRVCDLPFPGARPAGGAA